MVSSAETPSTTRASTPPLDAGNDWSADLLTLVAIFAATAVGSGLFFRAIVPLTLGPLAGLMAALGCRRWWSAGAVAAAGVLGGTALASRASVPAWRDGLFWLPDAALAAGVAVLIGIVMFLALRSSKRLRPLVSALAVVVIVGTMWFSGLALANSVTGQGWIPVQRLTSPVAFTKQLADEDIYTTYLAKLHQGEPYYPMAVSTLAAANAARGPAGEVALHSPLSYRMPTLYWLLAALPYNGGVIVIAVLAACTFGVVCAYLLARQYVAVVPALAGTAFVASMFAGYATLTLLDTETWAGIFGLAAVLFMVLSHRRPSRSWALVLAAVACAVVAALFRELGVAFLLVGLAAATADRREVARGYWAAWVGGLVVTFGAFAVHWSAAAAAARIAPPSVPAGFSWLHPDGVGLVAAMRLLATHGWFAAGVAWVLLALGMVGSVSAARDWPSRIALAGVCVGGPLVLLVLRPPGWATYGTPGYWGDLVVPTILACAPLAAVWIAAGRAAHTDDGSPTPVTTAEED